MINAAAANPFAQLFGTSTMADAPVGNAPVSAANMFVMPGAMTAAAMTTSGTTIAPVMSFGGTLMAAALPLGTPGSTPAGPALSMPSGFLSGIVPPIAVSAAVAAMRSPAGAAALPTNMSAAVSPLPAAIASPVRVASPTDTAPMMPLVAAPLPDLELRVGPDAEAPGVPVVAPMPNPASSAGAEAQAPAPVSAAPLPDLVLRTPPIAGEPIFNAATPVLPLPAAETFIPEAAPTGLATPTVLGSNAPVDEIVTADADRAEVPGKSLARKAKSQPAPAPLPLLSSPSLNPPVSAPAGEVPTAAVSTDRQTADTASVIERAPDEDVPISLSAPIMVAPPLVPPVIRDLPVAAIVATQPDAVTGVARMDAEPAPIGSDEEGGEAATGTEPSGRPQPAAVATSPAIARPAEPTLTDRFTAPTTVARAVTATPSMGSRTVRDDVSGGDVKSAGSPAASLATQSFAALVEQKAAPAAPVPAAAPAVAPEARVAAEPGRMGHEMGVAIARHAAEGGGEALTVRLNPAEFGRIDVTLSFDDRGTLRAAIAAESPAALDLLRRDSADLGKALTDAGMRTDAQSFRFDARQGGSEAGGQGAQGGQRWQQSGTTRAAADAPDETQPEYRPLRTRGRVDLMA